MQYAGVLRGQHQGDVESRRTGVIVERGARDRRTEVRGGAARPPPVRHGALTRPNMERICSGARGNGSRHARVRSWENESKDHCTTTSRTHPPREDLAGTTRSLCGPTPSMTGARRLLATSAPHSSCVATAHLGPSSASGLMNETGPSRRRRCQLLYILCILVCVS